MVLFALMFLTAGAVAYLGCVYCTAPSYNDEQHRHLKELSRASLYFFAPAVVLLALGIISLAQPFHSWLLCVAGWLYVVVGAGYSVGSWLMKADALCIPAGYYDYHNHWLTDGVVTICFYEPGKLKSPDTFHCKRVREDQVVEANLYGERRTLQVVWDDQYILYVKGVEDRNGPSVAERPRFGAAGIEMGLLPE